MFIIKVVKLGIDKDTKSKYYKWNYYSCDWFSFGGCNYNSKEYFDVIVTNETDSDLCDIENIEPEKGKLKKLYDLFLYDADSKNAKKIIFFQDCIVYIWKDDVLVDYMLCSEEGILDYSDDKVLYKF